MQVKKSFNDEKRKKNVNIKYRIAFILFLLVAIFIALLFQFGIFMLAVEPPALRLPKQTTIRGSIYDRNGSLLALQTKLYNLSANKNVVADPELCAKVLAPIINLSEDEIKTKFEKASTNFLYIKKKMTESEKAKVADLIKAHNLRGLILEEILNRTYPENKLASTVIGFLGDDGYGLYGVEYSLQNILSPPENTEGYNGRGYNVYLTLDNNIQYIMQKKSMQAMKTWKPESVIFIAADAKTGEILGYVSEPSPDLNNFTQSSPEQLIDRPANYSYEPGSVFKIFSMASFLELGSTSPDSTYVCDGAYHFKNKEIAPITCVTPHGEVTPEGIIQNSCNVGIAYAAENCSNNDFYKVLQEFGFGKKTGIELPGESRGIFSLPVNWSKRSKATIGIGQEIGVTALQLVTASTAFANKGKRLGISLISKITDSDEKVLYLHKPQVKSEPISAETAAEMLKYMKAENGIGWRAAVGDVPIAVKTGTAQMPKIGKRGYSKTDYVASSIALFPANNPQIILYMAVTKPQGQIYGSLIVAPIIREVASEIVDYYGINRDGTINIQHSGFISTNEGKKIILGDTMPNLIGKSKKELQSLFDTELNKEHYKILLEGEGYVYKQFPAPGAQLEEGITIHLNLK